MQRLTFQSPLHQIPRIPNDNVQLLEPKSGSNTDEIETSFRNVFFTCFDSGYENELSEDSFFNHFQFEPTKTVKTIKT